MLQQVKLKADFEFTDSLLAAMASIKNKETIQDIYKNLISQNTLLRSSLALYQHAARHGNLFLLEHITPAIKTVASCYACASASHYIDEAFLLAAEHGECDTLQYLLSQGANLNAKDKKGDTVLQIAAWYGYSKVTYHTVM